MADRATERLAAALEDCTLPELDHPDHVRVTWHYLRRDGLAAVLRELPERLRRYAASKGAPEYYHETITFAFVCLIHERLAQAEGLEWEAFAAAHPELFERGLLERYYRREVLESDFARRTFVWPAAAIG